MCNWNQPEFTPVIIAIETPDGQEVASQTYTPTVNIGHNTANKFTGVIQQTFEFDIPETGDYVIAFYTDATRNADFVLGQVSILPKEFFAAGIKAQSSIHHESDAVYDLYGRLVRRSTSGRLKDEKGQLKRGVYIIGGHKTIIR